MAQSPGDSLLKPSAITAYACSAFGIHMLYVSVGTMLPQLYAKELGINMAALGGALLFIRIFDALSDQVVGYLSDRTRTRFGPRKPWIFFGTILTLASCYFLFRPPSDAGLGYFLTWRIAFDIGWTMAFVAYTAWGAELSPLYKDRSRINGYVGFSQNLGVTFKNVAPIILFWVGIAQSSAYSLQQFNYLFWIALIVIPILTGITLIGAPTVEPKSIERPDMSGLWKALKVNKAFWYFLAVFIITNLGQGMLTLTFTFYDSYLKVGEYYPYMMVGYGSVGLVAVPFWVWFSNRFGKHKAYAVAMFINALAIQAFWLVDPTQHSQLMVAALGTVVLFFIAWGAACIFVAPPAILADVVDYGTWKTGEARAGSYFAFYSLVIRVAAAIGSSVAFILIDAFGYNVRAGAVNTAFANFGLLVTVVMIPSILKGIAGLVMWRFPLDARKHDILRRRLERRGVKEPEVAPATEPGLPSPGPRPAPAE